MNTSSPDSSARASAPVQGWIGFDGHCGLCQSGVSRWRGVFEPHGFVFLPLQDAWIKERLGLKEGEIPNEMKLLLANGCILSGIDAVVELCLAVWWLRPIGSMVRIPGLHGLSAAAYRSMARRRYHISVCLLGRPEKSRHRSHHTFFEAP